MADQENSNKRALIGIAIFAVLIIANLAVRSRGRSVPSPVITTTQVRAPSITAETTPATTAMQPVASQANPLTVSIPLPTETGGINEQILLLNQQAENFAMRVASVEEPFPPPERNILLPAELIDRFRWLTTTGTETVAIPTEGGPVVPQTKTIAILGEFKSGERRKFLVREDSRVYIVSENQLPQEGMISVSSGENGNIIVKDTTGQMHDLPGLTQPRDQKLEDAIRILKGGMPKQTALELLQNPETASLTATP